MTSHSVRSHKMCRIYLKTNLWVESARIHSPLPLLMPLKVLTIRMQTKGLSTSGIRGSRSKFRKIKVPIYPCRRSVQRATATLTTKNCFHLHRSRYERANSRCVQWIIQQFSEAHLGRPNIIINEFGLLRDRDYFYLSFAHFNKN